MSKSPSRERKAKALREFGALNPRPETVKDVIFQKNDFFDARDLVQVKYEMIRRVEADKQTVTQATADFGFSRPSFYHAQSALHRHGLVGLVPQKRGPRGAHKLKEEIVNFIEQILAKEDLLTSEIVYRVEERFAIKIHRRSIERALRRREKKEP